MTTYNFKCRDLNIFNYMKSEIVYQNINYNILERDLNNIIVSINSRSIPTKRKIDIINENIGIRINKLCHNLSILNKEELDKLNSYKSLINKNLQTWNKYKLFTNDYEMVYNSKYISSVASKKPLSRSYFKMVEMANIYCNNIIKVSSEIKTLHLAEGPGGFIEAICDLRNKYATDNNLQNKIVNDLYYGISLKTEKNVPGWDKSIDFLKRNKSVKIVTGITGTGDLINIDNINYLHTRFNNSSNYESGIKLITADGGFNFSSNQYIQEYNAALLIYAELVTALGCLSKGGMYIYKIYDMNYKISSDILFIAQTYFKHVTIFKPVTSRAGNSEKYVICMNFKGCNNDNLELLKNVLRTWIEINEKNEKVVNYFIRNKLFYEKNDYNITDIKIVDNLQILLCDEFKQLLTKINKVFNEKQINNINTTINFQYNNDWIHKRKKEQRYNAINWCIKNNITYNNNSIGD